MPQHDEEEHKNEFWTFDFNNLKQEPTVKGKIMVCPDVVCVCVFWGIFIDPQKSPLDRSEKKCEENNKWKTGHSQAMKPSGEFF